MATFGDVRRRIILLFVLGIGLPASLLGFLAMRGVRNDRALLEQGRQEDLRQIASKAGVIHDSGLVSVARTLDSVLAVVESEGASLEESLNALASEQSLIEAVFRLSSDGTVEDLLAPDLVYHAFGGLPPGGYSPPVGAESIRLDVARRLEGPDGDSRGALVAYQQLASGQSDPRIRAEAVVGIARIRREEGDFDAAAEGYRRLGSEFGHVPTAGGIPFSLAALLALGGTQILAGDTVGGVATLVDLYGRVVRTERGLSRAQFGFMATNLREPLDKVLSAAVGGELAALADSVRVLDSEEELARDRTERLLAFQASAGVELVSRGIPGPDSADGGYRRASLDLGGYSFYLLLGEARLQGPDEETDRWGILLDPDTLISRIVTTLQAEAGSEGIEWSLRGPRGEVLATSPEGPPSPGSGGADNAAVSAGLSGGVPPLTIDLFQPEEGLVRTLLTSRRGVFFYGFLLLAGILVFGLTLTVVTVSHQLALARLQSDFVSTVSHEFKSPLTAVRQIAETLQSGRAQSEEKRQKYYDILLEQSERLSVLIDRVLDFARMDSGQHTFSVHPMDIGEFLEGMVSQAQERFGHEGFEVRSEIQPGLPTVPLNADALRQAVDNLIDNAVKYSGDSREVVVRGFLEDGHVGIAVQDFGIGLDPKEQKRVFERFYRGGDALTRSVKGTGLGLTLVQQIVEGHGARLSLESQPGQGSTFSIRLPLEEVKE
jgi:signal transduction histidine kinase